MPLPVVPVWNLGNAVDGVMPAGLILLCSSGVLWSNQAGGIACNQPEAEGVYLPLPAPAVPFPHLCTWGGDDYVDAKVDHEKIQAAIEAAGWPLTVDPTRAGMEAWWPVTVSQTAGDDEFDPLFHFRGRAAVLVTENCD